MDNSLKGLILAAGVIVTCIVIGLGFYVSREAKNTSNSGTSQVSDMSSEYQDVDLALYDGLKVTGTEVAVFINKTNFAEIEGFSIIVKTGTTTVITTPYTTATYAAAKGSTTYINPTAQFLGSVQKDSNNIVQTVTFVQQK